MQTTVEKYQIKRKAKLITKIFYRWFFRLILVLQEPVNAWKPVPYPRNWPFILWKTLIKSWLVFVLIYKRGLFPYTITFVTDFRIKVVWIPKDTKEGHSDFRTHFINNYKNVDKHYSNNVSKPIKSPK